MDELAICALPERLATKLSSGLPLARQKAARLPCALVCPVGYTAVPYPVGGNGNLLHLNLEMNF